MITNSNSHVSNHLVSPSNMKIIKTQSILMSTSSCYSNPCVHTVTKQWFQQNCLKWLYNYNLRAFHMVTYAATTEGVFRQLRYSCRTIKSQEEKSFCATKNCYNWIDSLKLHFICGNDTSILYFELINFSFTHINKFRDPFLQPLSPQEKKIGGEEDIEGC